MFGAFIGGEFAADMVRGSAPPDSQAFIVKLLLCILCSCIALGLLVAMRRAVGPQLAGKSRAKNRG